MNWDDYRYFLAVARSGRLSHAGIQLNVDHATVGRRIKFLETSLSTSLFDRSPKGYSLTDAGRRLVDIAEAMETSAIHAQADIGGQDQVISGAVRIGATEGAASYILAEIGVELCNKHPDLEIEIVTVPRTFSLTKREADIAISVSAPTSGRLKFRKISDYTLHLYATQQYLEENPEIKSIEDLKHLRGIAYVQDLIHDKELDYFAQLGSNLKPNLTSTSVHVQLEATLKNGGVCIMHDFMARKHSELIKVLPEQINFTRTFWYIVHEDYARLQRIRIVSDAIIDEMKRKINTG